MSLATSIKDFSDTLNNLHTVNTSSLPILPFLQEIVVFCVKTTISSVLYLVTFEWFRDFSYLPLLNAASPQQLEIANAERLLFPGLTASPFVDSFFMDPISHLFSLSTKTQRVFVEQFPKSSIHYMLSGLVNSFFFSLPFSLPHLISIRRLFSQGIQAAVASLIGSIAAHSLFLISLFYGLRFLIIPWFSLEPITYIFGFLLNVLVIKELIQASPQRKQNVLLQKGKYTKLALRALPEFRSGIGINLNSNRFMQPSVSQPSQNTGGNNLLSLFTNRIFVGGAPIVSPFLLRITLLSFGYTWCEELNVFSSITHLTLNSQNSYLDLYPSTNVSTSLIVHTIYILGFIVGNCAFSLFFYFLIFKSGPVIASWTNLSSTKVNEAISKVVMLFILTFSFACFPYYGLDYIFGKVGGFLPEDPVYKETVLSPTKITVDKKNTLFIKAESADKKKHSSLLDINNFDNGVYVNNIDFNKFDNFPLDSKGSISRTTSFEKSNYRQENAWIRRNYLAKLRARPKKNNDNGNATSFYKTFKDPKAYYQKIQLESDKKQSKNVRDMQAKNRSGYFVGRQEGVLVDEHNRCNAQAFWDRILGFPGNDLFQIVKKKSSFGVTPFSAVYSDHHKYSKTEPFVVGEEKTKIPTKQNLVKNQRVTEAQVAPTFEFNDNQKDNEFDIETNIFAEKYTKGVKQKTSPPLLKRTKLLSTKKIIKRKFFLNPVYRILLQTEIDAFMKRQPVMHNIAENQDYDLYKKRVLLERYYNWLRYYSPLQQDLQNLYNISETKSFVDSVFHHQYKGTLKIAKRLFPVTFDPQQNNKKNRILSYDQTLYKSIPASENPLLHEELAFMPEWNSGKARTANTDSQRKRNDLSVGASRLTETSFVQSEALQRQDQTPQHSSPDSYKKHDSYGQNPTSRLPFNQSFSSKGNGNKSEDLHSKLQLRESFSMNNSPFIEESDISPFYAGWDDTLRRFVITNKFLVEKT